MTRALRKIEAQVAAHIKAWKPPAEVQKQIQELEAEQNRLSRLWAKLRDGFCDGSPCICDMVPQRAEFQSKLRQIEAQLFPLYELRNQEKSRKKAQLYAAYRAKLKYRERK